MALTGYLTICEKGTAEMEIRRSRFIACAFPITDETEAERFLEERRKQDWKATHHCFAYTLGLKQEIQKAGDDGEPSGTAGVPILEVLKRHQICNTLIVVTRYFGGIKLGAGGLIRAYAHSARAGLLAAGIIEQVPASLWQLTVAYHLQGSLDNKLRESPYIIKNMTFSDKVDYAISTRQNEDEAFRKQITDWTNGQAILTKQSEAYRSREVAPSELNLN